LNAIKNTNFQEEMSNGAQNKTRQNDVLILSNFQREHMNKTTMQSGFKELMMQD